MEQDNFDGQQEEAKPKNKSPFHAFIPKDDYFFTPIILGINVLVFVVMIISGVHPMLPTGDSLIEWGANYQSRTMGGEPWRLFTSMFLHFGIFHLAVNMYALYSLGRMIEPFIGKWRFLFLYLFAGLGGSAVSLWWHANELGVSAGASGAIFGLFGLFAALLTTDLIDQTIRKDLLKSMGSAILLNLLIGLYGGIDNSAHIGGLLTGAAGGYLCYFDLRDWYRRKILKFRGVIFTGILTSGIIATFWMISPSAEETKKIISKKNEERSEQIERLDILFARYDSERLAAYQFATTIDSATTRQEINSNMTKRWEHCIALIDSMKKQELSPEGLKYVDKVRLSTLYGLEGAKFYERSITEKRKDLIDSGKLMLNKHTSSFEAVNAEMQEDVNTKEGK